MITQIKSNEEFFTLVFSDKGPRGGWKQISTENEMMMKCLLVGLECIKMDQLNAFLKSVNLPDAFLMEVEEYENLIKYYVCLKIDKTQYLTKIKPVVDGVESNYNAITKIFSKLNIFE